eukprot:TRINITY_DN13323_c0_g1_i1.p1 TRINITY_DN13323_c0_g1~~TRINITY_DN13323_c0_g1_i1.p1  ORF type:complete len:558 (-),score=18.70 TRINITY_DN13323_c0_g1_i1:1206-2879(-)
MQLFAHLLLAFGLLCGLGAVAPTIAVQPALLPGAWTWLMGSNVSTICSRGFYRQPHPSNLPCGRSQFGTWVDDHNGYIYIYGGRTETDYADDVWRFDTKSNIWTWIAGSGQPNVNPVPGYDRLPAATNSPGARANFAYTSEISPEYELRMWIYGGLAPDEASGYADLWYFSNVTLMWTRWLGCPTNTLRGDSCTTSTGVLGPMPGSRIGSSMFIDSTTQTIYIAFGTTFIIDAGFFFSARWNDLWSLDIRSNNWTRVYDSPFPESGGEILLDLQVGSEPAARTGASVLYDAENRVVHFYGGDGQSRTRGDIFQFRLPPPGAISVAPHPWIYTPGTDQTDYNFGPQYVNVLPGRPADIDFRRNTGAFPNCGDSGSFAPTRNGKHGLYFSESRSEAVWHSIWAFSTVHRRFLWPLYPWLNGTNWANGVKMNASYDNVPPLRFRHGIAVVGMSMYVFGGLTRRIGSNSDGTLSNELWRFDLECWPGTFQNPRVDYFDCVPCPAGSYQPGMNRNVTSCIVCPFNTTGILTGAYEASEACNVTCPTNTSPDRGPRKSPARRR